MIITEDEELIRSILDDETVIQGFSHGERVEDLSNAIYFYEEGIGLFPARVSGKVVSIHAAIPKKNRGIKAIKAATRLAQSLIESGYDVTARVRYTDRHVKRFVKMVGFDHLCDNDNYHIYRYSDG